MDLIREIWLVVETDGARKSPDHYTQEE